ncbi:MAG: site-2 protease family protein [Betaproteobacteria bacterium]|nr:site-2 protease family protein [Betaproteobacteria bacterium]
MFALPVLFAITLHEAAHGFVARHFGDMTAYAAGRVSLNPLRHIDLVGTIIVPLVSLLVADILFGWAKPVPVNFSNLHRPKQDMLWVAAAGPLSNLAMALFWAGTYKLGMSLVPGNPALAWLVFVGACGIFVNVIFMVLNLLPLPPLDGGRMLVSVLPHRLAWRFAKIEPYGFVILIVLLLTKVLGYILWPLIAASISGIGLVFNIAPAELFYLLRAL